MPLFTTQPAAGAPVGGWHLSMAFMVVIKSNELGVRNVRRCMTVHVYV